MIYIDANIFIFAFADNSENGEFSRKILEMIETKKIAAATSSLTIDEVLWALRKEIPQNEAIRACKTILKIKGLKILRVDKTTIFESLDIVSSFNLKPRDAIHVATMNLEGIKEIISEDLDFDKLKDIKRFSILKFIQ